MSYCRQTACFFRRQKGRGHIRANLPTQCQHSLPPLLKVTCWNSQKNIPSQKRCFMSYFKSFWPFPGKTNQWQNLSCLLSPPRCISSYAGGHISVIKAVGLHSFSYIEQLCTERGPPLQFINYSPQLTLLVHYKAVEFVSLLPNVYLSSVSLTIFSTFTIS